MAAAYNTSYVGGENRKITVQVSMGDQRETQDPVSKITKAKRAGVMA
jgi:hypothetical protein